MERNKKARVAAFWNLKLAFTCLFIFIAILSVNAETTLKERLEQHVYTLASDEMRGRLAGTEYARMAAEYIINQFEEIGIEPYFDDSYLQYFWNNSYQNVVGIIRGNDPVLKDEYIIVGAHYDHIGTFFGRIRNGADDNASGVAALIELGRELLQNQSSLKRSVILIAFDAEEAGLIGSAHFINRWELPLDSIKLMISIDMVGWYQATEMVEYAGSGTLKRGNELVLNPEIIPEELNVSTKKFETSIFVATDTFPFAAKRIPTLYVNTGLKSPYHSSRDEAHLIDYDGMTLIVGHLTSFIEIVSQEEVLEPTGRLAKKHKPRRPVDFGISINFDSVYHHFITGKSDTLLGAGLTSQINFGLFAIRPELLYDRIRQLHSSGSIVRNNITVPLSLVLQTPDHWIFGGDIYFGGYYSYCLNGNQGGEVLDFDNTFNRTELGLSFGFGYYLRPFKIGVTYRFPLTDFNKSSNNNGYNQRRGGYAVFSYTF